MVHLLVSPDGRVLEAPEDRKGLGDFALEHRLITERKHTSNVIELLKPQSGKKQLNYWQPLHKLRWLAQVERTTGVRLEREPVPLLGGTAEFFVGSVAPMVIGMADIQSRERLTRLLHGTAPFDKPGSNYGGWIALKKEGGDSAGGCTR